MQRNTDSLHDPVHDKVQGRMLLIHHAYERGQVNDETRARARSIFEIEGFNATSPVYDTVRRRCEEWIGESLDIAH